MSIQRLSHAFIFVTLLVALCWPVAAFAQSDKPAWDMPPRLVDEPEGIAQLRQKYQNMTEQQLVDAGFQVEPVCVGADMVGLTRADGGMGYHAINKDLYGSQFPSGKMDPDNPPIVTLDQNKRVAGIEWEAADLGQGAPQLYGQTANLGPAHPGVPKPHYMLHAFFRPGGKVLFGDFDPNIHCPAMPNSGGGGMANRADTSPFQPIAALVLVTLAGTAFVLRGRV